VVKKPNKILKKGGPKELREIFYTTPEQVREKSVCDSVFERARPSGVP
jgi:hypothetical protein